jgi:DNA-nicking Smr family endonuclease
MVKRPTVSDPEILAFALRDVKPLPGRTINKQFKIIAPKASAGIKRVSLKRPQSALTKSAKDRPVLYHGVAPGLDRRTVQRMKRGQVQIEARLDLHGYHQEEARNALNQFVASEATSHRRCILVITGKGMRVNNGEERQIGVLREKVPLWLNEEPNRSRVLSFCHAKLSDGGAGALYVLLKKRSRGEKA